MALPLIAAPGGAESPAFDARLAGLEARYRRLWWSTGPETPRAGALTSRRQRWRNGRASRRLIDHLAAEIERCPQRRDERRAWRDRLRETVSRFGERRLGWPSGYRQLLFADAFFDVTARFTREARAFDRDLGTEELMQALRNVWIMSSIQMLLDLEVRFSPAIFAYSMLYPETDNLLDDPAVPAAAKRELSRRLGERLAGRPLAPQSQAEGRIWQLLETIESQYPIDTCPEIWASLRAIHRGQADSLRQQAGPLDRQRLLAISVAKGGASVLADGYLVAGRLSAAEADFCFGYGVFLQLLDDLQDASADRALRHATLFSTATPPLDRLAARLWHFMQRVVDGHPRFAGPAHAGRRDLVLRNCRSLLIGAVAEEPRLFSRAFRRALERRWPLGFRAMRRLRRHADRRLRRSADELRRRRGVESLFELLDEPA